MKLTINNIEFTIDNYTRTDEEVTCTYHGTDYNIENLFAINNKEVASASIEDETTIDLSAYNHSMMTFILTPNFCEYTVHLTVVTA